MDDEPKHGKIYCDNAGCSLERLCSGKPAASAERKGISDLSIFIGEAFEWLAGIFLQRMLGNGRIIPQARLMYEVSGGIASAYADFCVYFPDRMDCELFEVKWTGGRQRLDEAVEKYLPAASSQLNKINSGKNINIDTKRRRKLNLIVHNDIGYANPHANYWVMPKIAGFESSGLPVYLLNRHIGMLESRADAVSLRKVSESLKKIFLFSFESGRDYPLERYLSMLKSGLHGAEAPAHFRNGIGTVHGIPDIFNAPIRNYGSHCLYYFHRGRHFNHMV